MLLKYTQVCTNLFLPVTYLTKCHCTGHGKQTEDVSWWPKHSAWMKAGSYAGVWTPWDERWFQERLKDIYDNNASPMNAHQWKNTLKRLKATRQLYETLDQASWDFLERAPSVPVDYLNKYA